MNELDTIAAISTPPGEGGIGIIRISGEDAAQIGALILRHPSGRKITSWPERQVRLGLVMSPEGKFIDEVLYFLFRKGRSYTGEELLEIQGHGGYQNLKKILNSAIKAGARLAEPGEFTKRAFLNGRLDLAQAEAVIDLIRAQTDLAHQVALTQLRGELSTVIQRLENSLFEILVPIEAALDYPEDEIPDLEREQVAQRITALCLQLEELLAQAAQGVILREAASVVLAGRPNVGKSSLLNSLLGEERVIVTPIPGTTRDFVAETIDLDGIPVRLIDTAGLRESEDLVEKAGVERTREIIKEAHLILVVLDAGEELTAAEEEMIANTKHKPLIILNKTDLPTVLSVKELKDKFPDYQVLSVSAKTGDGLAALKEAIREALIGRRDFEEHPVLVTRLRHKEALEEALANLQSVAKGLSQQQSEDLLAVDLRAALEALGRITGRSVSEEIIDRIFSQFCLGK
ncbi:MAG: tRNA uridine-5-carboxymethylaminomethyl(34) synthesis GTPase MnmE [Firmicutes bacterium]|nr:tRNA uridine-5-carboxymethylaminomethyl(34) synthesis GTPase MnmE [Bacillota bacterium]